MTAKRLNSFPSCNANKRFITENGQPQKAQYSLKYYCCY